MKKKIIITITSTIVILLAIEAAVCLIVMNWGVYNISTSNHDNSVINWFFDTGMTRSVAHHAKKIKVPSLEGAGMVQEGFRHYHEMCVGCHGAPGVTPGGIAKGLWPDAPDLAKTVPTWTPAQLFWITKNGVKFTAMPAWGPTHEDAKLWAIVAFLEKLPHLSPAQYQEMQQNNTGTLEKNR